jgi:hypothetical protein
MLLAKAYLMDPNGNHQVLKTIKAWKVFQLEKVTIRRLFLENVLCSAGSDSCSFKRMCFSWRDEHLDKHSNVGSIPSTASTILYEGKIANVSSNASSVPYEEEIEC